VKRCYCKGEPPEALQAEAAALPGRVGEGTWAALTAMTGEEELRAVCLASPWLADWLAREADAALALASSLDTEAPPELPPAVIREGDSERFDAALRRYRHGGLARIAWRDISGRAALDQTLADTSLLADQCILAAVDHHHLELAAREGMPSSASGAPQSLIVFALGKLGGGELNFSSDVDLIFAYEEAGMTRGGRGELDNQDYFTRLARRVIRSLDAVTSDGFAFRVDTRLRPFGDSGPLVMSLAAARNYYLNHARDWERYAMIKARAVTGGEKAVAHFEEALQPFVYRRYLDFGAIEALREMKSAIQAEVERKGLRDDVKRGPGGIREVEFIVQCLQLIRGGRLPGLRTRSFHEALAAAAGHGLVSAEVASSLRQAYSVLRFTEHRLQQVADRQTQRLPRDAGARARLAFALGATDWAALEGELGGVRACIAGEFGRLLAAEGEGPESRASARQMADWHEGSEAAIVRLLLESGHEPAEALVEALQKLHAASHAASSSAHASERLARVLPRLLAGTARERKPRETLERALGLVTAILGRSGYLALLLEHPSALTELVRLCAASPWVAAQIRAQPVLLDDLLDPARLYAPPSPAELRELLAQRCAAHAPDDLEQQMNALREFRHSQVLRVAAADLMGTLPLANVSDHLTAIAECVLTESASVAARHVVGRHGPPVDAGGQVVEPLPFLMVGYGKLGGMELSYGSDLDLVFLYDGRVQSTAGRSAVDAATFFNRLGQRVIHCLTTFTPAGRAYEVDARLRPNGASGMLVSSLAAFEQYQLERAWTWEHQALIRARVVCGPPGLRSAFDGIRHRVLIREREIERLRSEVLEMRRRMLRERDRAEETQFDLKLSPGGITDIEFIVQYAVLAYASRHPELTAWTDNLRLLGTLARCGALPTETAEGLTEAWFTFRSAVHRSALLETPNVVPGHRFALERERVLSAWRTVFGEALV
jgi:[glutamine synthetase] adenylyltransferase / [glutamine synthetase]-adenylyl-L-tyrosine phosphorylase